MKVAFLMTSFPEAAHTYLIQQIVGLIDRGHDVEIFTNLPCQRETEHRDVGRYGLRERTHTPMAPRQVWKRVLAAPGAIARFCWRAPDALLRGFDVRRYGMLAWSGATIFGGLPLLDRRRFDIIHAHFGPNGIRGAYLLDAGLLRGPLITSFHGYDVNVFPRRYGPSVYRRLFAVGQAYTANTRFTRERAIAWGCPADRIEVLPVGLDPGRYRFRERTPAPDGVVRVLSVGNLVEVKGLEYGIRSVAQLAERFPRLHYTIVGDGPLRRRLETLAESLRIADRVTFTGALPDVEVEAHYEAAHVFILPGVVASDGAEEGQGLVLVEAQASGLPVVASRVGGIPETVAEGESAVLVPPGDVPALAEAIAQLIESPGRWVGMGRAGRRLVESRYDRDRLAEQLEQLYLRVCGGPTAADEAD